MSEGLAIVARQTAVLFLLMAFGMAVRWFRIFDGQSMKRMADYVLAVVTPCLIVTSFQRPFDRSALAGVCWSFAAALFAHAAGILLARLAVRDRDEARMRAMRFAAVFSNAGYMGIPLQYAVLGPEGVFYGSIYIVVFHILCWTYGVWEIRGGFMGDGVAKALVNPGLAGIAIGLPFFLFSLRLPPVLAEPVKMTGGLFTPLAMLVLGYHLAGAKFAPALSRSGTYAVLVLRHIVVPAAVLAALPLVPGMDRTVSVAAVIPAAAPVGASVTMFSARYGGDAEFATALVAVSTVLSVVTMPLMVSAALALL